MSVWENVRMSTWENVCMSVWENECMSVWENESLHAAVTVAAHLFSESHGLEGVPHSLSVQEREILRQLQVLQPSLQGGE